jgi:hypothetical protein
MMKLVPLREITGQAILAGRLPGQALRPLIERSLHDAGDQPVVVLDFSGIDYITASYFLGAFTWLWEPELVLVIANASPEVREDIELALRAANLKALFGELSDQRLAAVQPFNLEGIEVETYNKVRTLGTATANDLHMLDRTIQPNAWSNRLALLFRYRLLRRKSVGRQLAYSVCER